MTSPRTNIQFRITQVNEVCLLIEFATVDSKLQSIDYKALNKTPISPHLCLAINHCKQRILELFAPQINDIVSAYQSLLIYFDLLTVGTEHFIQRLSAACTNALNENPQDTTLSKTIEIPVLYNEACGPDLKRVSEQNKLSIQDVIEQHCSHIYWVYALGFIPGFAYLGFVDKSLATPRLSTPRTSVPKGSVGIADTQTGVYPSASPGGWNIIGRSPTPLLHILPDQQTPQPTLNIADRVKFRSIDESEFVALGGSLDKAFVP
ncbi:MAG: 5-oxoprolinase subunit PxpB [Agarilytica sp.]